MDFTATKTMVSMLAEPPRKPEFKFHALLPVIIVFLVTTYLTVGLRFYTRRKYAKLWWDDWLMALALVCTPSHCRVEPVTNLSSFSSLYSAVAQ